MRGGHGVGRAHSHLSIRHLATGGRILSRVTPADPPELTYQGEDYEENGIGPVLGVRRSHHWEKESGETEPCSHLSVPSDPLTAPRRLPPRGEKGSAGRPGRPSGPMPTPGSAGTPSEWRAHYFSRPLLPSAEICSPVNSPQTGRSALPRVTR